LATRCPKCATPGAFAADEIGEAGRFVRCPRCRTTWLARNIAGDVFGPAGSFPAPALRQPAPIIEGAVLKAARPRPAPSAQPTAPAKPFVMPPPPFPPRPSNRRLAGLGIALTLVVILGLAVPIVAAIPGLAGLFNAGAGLTIEAVTSAALRRGGVDTIVVEGVLANHTERGVDVPAIRISLRTDAGGEVYSWQVEPTATRLAAGESIGFRSALTNPAPGADQIAVSLASRHPITIGMR
jgi:predicted Zn finger-like uncharacterized protein